MGGLGNQLFQFFALTSAAIRLQKRPVLDLQWFCDFDSRSFELDRLFDLRTLDVDVKEPSDAPAFPGLRKVRWWMWQRVPSTGKFIERGPYFDSRFTRETSLRAMVGYFQSWRYFGDELEMVSVLVKESLDQYCMTSQLRDEPADFCSVALHVRLGDYKELSNRRIYGDAPIRYIQRALSAISADIGVKPNVTVFSDSPSEALRLVQMQCRDMAEFELAADADVFTHLSHMSSADYLIMANSSLSWWAGLLADSRGSQVFCPTPWTLEPTNDGRDLVLPRWLSLNRG